MFISAFIREISLLYKNSRYNIIRINNTPSFFISIGRIKIIDTTYLSYNIKIKML